MSAPSQIVRCAQLPQYVSSVWVATFWKQNGVSPAHNSIPNVMCVVVGIAAHRAKITMLYCPTAPALAVHPLRQSIQQAPPALTVPPLMPIVSDARMRIPAFSARLGSAWWTTQPVQSAPVVNSWGEKVTGAFLVQWWMIIVKNVIMSRLVLLAQRALL